MYHPFIDSIETFRSGKFVYTAEGNTVLVTKDNGPLFININMYTYKDHETAADAAWKMKCRQDKS